MSDKRIQEGALEPVKSPSGPPPSPRGTQPGPAVNPLTGRPLSAAASASTQR